ncbi:hypothetical protein D3C72_1606110 [compost metagenome]
MKILKHLVGNLSLSVRLLHIINICYGKFSFRCITAVWKFIFDVVVTTKSFFKTLALFKLLSDLESTLWGVRIFLDGGTS